MNLVLYVGILCSASLHLAICDYDNTASSTENEFTFGIEDVDPYFADNSDQNEEMTATARGASNFTQHFDYSLINPRENYVSSPLSAWMMLTMFREGANGSTQHKVQQVLQVPDDEDRWKGNLQFYSRFSYWDSSKLFIANRMYAAQGINIEESFQYELNNANNNIENVDFSKPELAVKNINNKIKSGTENHVQDTVDLDDVYRNTSLIALSAVYFKGSFERSFGSASIEDFYFSENDIKAAPMMSVRDYFRYGTIPHANATYVEIPYQRELDVPLSLFVILPDSFDGIDELRKHEFDVNELLANGTTEDVRISLPKFNVSTKVDLEAYFRKFGLGELFESPDLSGMSQSHVVADKVIQKIVVEVDEHGGKPPIDNDNVHLILGDNIIFNADHPFLAMIATVGENPVTLFKIYYEASECPIPEMSKADRVHDEEIEQWYGKSSEE